MKTFTIGFHQNKKEKEACWLPKEDELCLSVGQVKLHLSLN
jgi:hypothetical protein